MSTSYNLKESDLVPFGSAAAGHEGVLTDATGSTVIKPSTRAEVAFYESANVSHPDFAEFMPKYMGTLTRTSAAETAPPPAVVLDPTTATTTPLAPSSTSDLAPEAAAASNTAPSDAFVSSHGHSLDSNLCIVLSNAAEGFKKPNVLDVKLGAKLWDEAASAEKRARLDKVSAESTSSSLGFRIAGMKTYKGKGGGAGVDDDGFKAYGKMYGRQLTPDNITDGFREFFLPSDSKHADAVRKLVIPKIKAEVDEVLAVLSKKESRMIGASLLFVTEGDPDALAAALEREANPPPTKAAEGDDDEDDDDDDDEDLVVGKTHSTTMIDFAHATWVPGQGQDENVLRGLRSVTEIFGTLKG
ncbi:MAG: hypothetical protein M1833_006897 [Piccolia ochrophora]|nr:MAG: hypothetical protein M1833_006897 [Piccolia ochrophora]